MKKVFLLLGAVVALCSCGTGAAKVETQADSLNYAIGYMNGAQIEEQVLSKQDDEDKATKALYEAIKESYNQAKDEDPDDLSAQAHNMGKQVGKSLRQMQEQGLLGNPDWEANPDLIAQGLVNALMKHKGGMTEEEATAYIQKVMMQAQQQAAQQAPQQAPQQQAPQQQ